MPSALVGLFRSLSWSDYRVRQGKPPGAGQSAAAANTGYRYSEGGISFAGSGSEFQLADSITVTASFDSGGSYVMSWVFDRPQQFQDDMLNHEQGHYNINALICRDYFTDVMLLKGQTFATAKEGADAIKQLRKDSVAKIGSVQSLYDSEVHPEQGSGLSHGPIQQNWDGYLQTSFTQVRPAGTTSPDGGHHRMRLIDVLNFNGKRV
jgi:hypothetical protein